VIGVEADVDALPDFDQETEGKVEVNTQLAASLTPLVANL
jgi:hypothetical protein